MDFENKKLFQDKTRQILPLSEDSLIGQIHMSIT